MKLTKDKRHVAEKRGGGLRDPGFRIEPGSWVGGRGASFQVSYGLTQEKAS